MERKLKVKVYFVGLSDDKIGIIERIISGFFILERSTDFASADIIFITRENVPQIDNVEVEDFKPIFLFSEKKLPTDEMVKLVGRIRDVITPDDIHRLPFLIKRELREKISMRLKWSQMKWLQTYDKISDLPARETFLLKIKDVLENSVKKEFAMFLIRLSNLDIINTNLGSDATNRIISIVAEEIKKLSSYGDIVGRVSFRDFAIFKELKEGNSEKEIHSFSEKILQKLTKYIDYEGIRLKVLPSIGISLFPADSQFAEDLLMFAEKASTESEGRGSKITKFSDLPRGEIIVEKKLISHIFKALKEKRLYMVYQPIFYMDDFKRIGIFESLLRYGQKDMGIGPDIFIALSEKIGAIEEISGYILNEVFEIASKLKKYHFSINISPKHLTIPKIYSLIINGVKRFNIEPQRIIFEIGEKSLYTEIISAKDVIEELKKIGFRFAIDDFGSGQSSLSLMREIPFDILKIDTSIIKLDRKKEKENKNIDSIDDFGKLLIKSVIEAAKKAGKRIIAEGVETADDLEEARKLYCDMVQGYMFSFPLKQKEVFNLLVQLNR